MSTGLPLMDESAFRRLDANLLGHSLTHEDILLLHRLGDRADLPTPIGAIMKIMVHRPQAVRDWQYEFLASFMDMAKNIFIYPDAEGSLFAFDSTQDRLHGCYQFPVNDCMWRTAYANRPEAFNQLQEIMDFCGLSWDIFPRPHMDGLLFKALQCNPHNMDPESRSRFFGIVDDMLGVSVQRGAVDRPKSPGYVMEGIDTVSDPDFNMPEDSYHSNLRRYLAGFLSKCGYENFVQFPRTVKINGQRRKLTPMEIEGKGTFIPKVVVYPNPDTLYLLAYKLDLDASCGQSDQALTDRIEKQKGTVTRQQTLLDDFNCLLRVGTAFHSPIDYVVRPGDILMTPVFVNMLKNIYHQSKISPASRADYHQSKMRQLAQSTVTENSAPILFGDWIREKHRTWESLPDNARLDVLQTVLKCFGAVYGIEHAGLGVTKYMKQAADYWAETNFAYAHRFQLENPNMIGYIVHEAAHGFQAHHSLGPRPVRPPKFQPKGSLNRLMEINYDNYLHSNLIIGDHSAYESQPLEVEADMVENMFKDMILGINKKSAAHIAPPLPEIHVVVSRKEPPLSKNKSGPQHHAMARSR